MQQQIIDALPDWNIEVRTCGQAYRRAGSFRKQIKLESERRQADSRAFRDKSSKRQKIVVSGGARERPFRRRRNRNCGIWLLTVTSSSGLGGEPGVRLPKNPSACWPKLNCSGLATETCLLASSAKPNSKRRVKPCAAETTVVSTVRLPGFRCNLSKKAETENWPRARVSVVRTFHRPVLPQKLAAGWANPLALQLSHNAVASKTRKAQAKKISLTRYFGRDPRPVHIKSC